MVDGSAPALLNHLVEALDEAILILARQGGHRQATVIYSSPAVERIVGRRPDDMIGKPIDVLRGRDTDLATFGRLARALEESVPVDLELMLGSEQSGGRMQVAGRPLVGGGQPYLVRLRSLAWTGSLAVAAQDLKHRWRVLSELTSDAIYYLRVGPDCRLALDWVTDGFIRLTGYRLEELDSMGGWPALIEPADLRAVQRRAQRFLAGEQATVEYRIVTRDRDRRWLREVGRPEWDEAGELVVGALCVARDVTEEHLLQDRLQAEEREREALSGLAGGLVLRLDADGQVQETSGLPRGELGGRLSAAVGQSLEDALGPALAAKWREQMREALPGQAVRRLQFSHRSTSSEEHYEARFRATGEDTLLALLKLRPQTRGSLPASGSGTDGRLRALLESLPFASLLLSPELVVEELNPAAEHLTGWQRDGTVGRVFLELLVRASQQPAVVQDLDQVRMGVRVPASEAWLRLPGGQEGRIVWSYTPLFDVGGAVVAILAQGQGLAPSTVTASPVVDDQQRLKAIIDHIADGVITLDAGGRILAFSRSAEVIFGYRQQEMVGSSIERVILGRRSGDGARVAVLESDPPSDEAHEGLGRRKGGEIIPIEFAVHPVQTAGQPLHILTVRDITLRKQTEETIRSLAYHDPLTGLPNRVLFNDRLSQGIERARRTGQALAVMILDLDRFKLINDSLGLGRGDQVLQRVGERVRAAVRKSDTVARLAGDDFLLLLPGTEGAESAAKVAQKVLDTLHPLVPINGQELHVGASLGIALYPHDGEDAETLIRNADTALYRAKERSRGSYQFYTADMNAAAFERLMLETQLRRALERQELVLHYQPLVRIDTGTVIGVEALVRWRHPDLGLISPAEFIPLAEETSLILPIGRWVLASACAQVRRWQEEGFSHLRLAVNMSGRQFQDGELVQSIADALKETGLDPANLDLELTESSIMQDAEATVAKLGALDALGIRLSIDDFGTGYSSLSYLKRFPIRALKIDQSFIRDITTSQNDAAIAQAIIALAKSLKLRVIAEGVETWQQLEVLRRYGCMEMQGYLFSRAVPPDQLLALLKSARRFTQ